MAVVLASGRSWRVRSWSNCLCFIRSSLFCLALSLGVLSATRGADLDEFPTPAAATPAIDGTWRWNFTMPDGTPCRPRLVLEIEEGRLTGTSSFRPGTEQAITNATLNGDQIRFQVIRERNGHPITTTYSGVWSGRYIRGKVASDWNGATQSHEWEAIRAHDGAEGLWKWTMASRGGRKVEARVKLAQDGELLTGYVPGAGRGLRRWLIKNGSILDGEVYFELERGTGVNKVLTIYKGKQTGDSIKGTIETITGDSKKEAVWEAHRPD
jgi:hypothetical protein